MRWMVVLLVLLMTTAVGAQELTVVASTTWVGAMAEAAGAQNVLVLAPIELRHPPEYDFSPRDIGKAVQADLILWGGYEGFIRNLKTAANIPDERLLQINTNNAPPLMKQTVAALAARFGTEPAYREWELALDQVVAELRKQAEETNVSGIRVVVQFHQQRFAEWLGYDIIGVIGPADLTPTRLAQLLAEKPDLMIDNWHSAQGEAFAQAGVAYASLINFPGPGNTRSLLDVLIYNGRQLGLLE